MRIQQRPPVNNPQPPQKPSGRSDYEKSKIIKDTVTYVGIAAADAGISAVTNRIGHALTSSFGPWVGIPAGAAVGAVGGFFGGLVGSSIADNVASKVSGNSFWEDELGANIGGAFSGAAVGGVSGVLGGFGVSAGANAAGSAAVLTVLGGGMLYADHFHGK